MSRQKRIESLVNMLEKDPGDLFLNYALGLEYAADLATQANAESQFRIVINIDKHYIPAYYQLGKLFEQLMRIPEAIEFYRIGLNCARNKKDLKAAGEFEEALFLLED